MKRISSLFHFLENPVYLAISWIIFSFSTPLYLVRYYLVSYQGHSLLLPLKLLFQAILALQYGLGLFVLISSFIIARKFLQSKLSKNNLRILVTVTSASFTIFLLDIFLLGLEGKFYSNFLYSRLGLIPDHLKYSSIIYMIQMTFVVWIFLSPDKKTRTTNGGIKPTSLAWSTLSLVLFIFLFSSIQYPGTVSLFLALSFTVFIASLSVILVDNKKT
jgi:hypothetical protein